MKFMLLLIDTEPPAGAELDLKKEYAAVTRWWDEQEAAGRILQGYELALANTATTVSKQNGVSTITDGPYIEAKESIGGYAIIDVADKEAAVELANGWPISNSIVEVRPLMRR